MKSIHDPPYHKKVHKSDSKAVKDLTGHGSKKKRSFKVPGRKKRKGKKKSPRNYIKSGAPFNLDPPKRRPAGKLSAPPGAVGMPSMEMEETEILSEKQTQFDILSTLVRNARKGDWISIVPLKEIDPSGKGLFCKGQKYKATVIGPPGPEDVEAESSAVVCWSPLVKGKTSREKILADVRAASAGRALKTMVDLTQSRAYTQGKNKSLGKWLLPLTSPKPKPAAPLKVKRGPTKHMVSPSVATMRRRVKIAPKKELPGKTPYKDLGAAFKKLFVAAGATPLATATPLPGVGMGIPIADGRVLLITDIDLTGPGVGVGLRPDQLGVSPKTLAKLMRKIPGNPYEEYAATLDKIPNVPILYLGVEMHGPVPLPFAGVAGGEKEMVQIKKWLNRTVSDPKDKSTLEKWIDQAISTGEVHGAAAVETGKAFLKSVGFKTPEGLDLDPVLGALVASGAWPDLVMRVALLQVAIKASMRYGAQAFANIIDKELTPGVVKGRKTIKDFVKKYTDLLGKEILIGDSQVARLVGPLRSKLGGLLGGTNILKGAGAGITPASIITKDKDRLEKMINKNPSLAIITLGGTGIRGAAQLVKMFPKETQIIWVGPSPAVKITDMALAHKNFSWTKDSKDPSYIKDKIGISRINRAKKLGKILADFPNVTYINPNTALPAEYIDNPGRRSDGIHYTPKGANIIASAIKNAIKGIAGKTAAARTAVARAESVVKIIQQKLTPKQKQNAAIIEQKFKEAGWSDNVIAAAIVAAWGESTLNAKAIGDCKKGTPRSQKTCGAVEDKTKMYVDKKGRKKYLCNSVGLFQLYNYGVGKGMTCEERQDPFINTKTLLRKQKSRIQEVADLDKTGASIADLAVKFAERVEVSDPKYHPRYRVTAAALFNVERIENA